MNGLKSLSRVVQIRLSIERCSTAANLFLSRYKKSKSLSKIRKASKLELISVALLMMHHVL